MRSTPAINVTRLIYLLICEAAGTAIVLSTKGNTIVEIPLWVGIIGGLCLALAFIGMERLMKGYTLRGFSTGTFGLAVGLICAWLLTRVHITAIIELSLRQYLSTVDPVSRNTLIDAISLSVDAAIYASLGFLGAMISLRGNRDDFAFIIPYVRFRQDASSGHPIVVDLETIIDGRIIHILKSGFLTGRLIVPRFVLTQLQLMAENSAVSIRQRGQRGLQTLEALQKSPEYQLSIHDTRQSSPSDSHSTTLIEITKLLGARLLTIDDNLAKICNLQSIDVLNIHDLDEALRPVLAIGQRIRIALVRPGKEDHQAVGYLPDGSMIVTNHAASKIGETADIIVVSTIQTSGGTIVFAELYQA